jgi:RNA polymerase sigma-B factor
MTRIINPAPGLSNDGAEERHLLVRWNEHRDLQAKGELLRRLLPVARGIARRYETSGEPLEDLVQVASIGLLKAVDRFDPNRGVPLRCYAARMADGELRHYLRDLAGPLYIPRALYERMQAVSRATRRMAVQLGHRPTPAEIADTLDLSLGEVIEALQTGRALRTYSLDHQFRDADGPGGSYADTVGEEDPGFELVEQRSVIERVWNSLSQRERESLRLRHVEDLTFREIADRLGTSSTHAARIVTRASERLQAVLRAADMGEED